MEQKYRNKECQIITEVPRKVRFNNKERFLYNHKNALKIGLIGREPFVVTLSFAIEIDSHGKKKDKEIIKMHTLIQKEGDILEEVPDEILDDMMKKIRFF